MWRDELGQPLPAKVGFSKQERQAALGTRPSLGRTGRGSRGAVGLPFGPSAKEEWTLYWSHQQGRGQEESSGPWRASKAVAVGRGGGEDSSASWGSGPGVNAGWCPVCSALPASAEQLRPGDWP